MTKSKKAATHGQSEERAGLPHPVTPEQCHRLCRGCAYYIAERRGGDTGCRDEDWAQAELEIDRLLAEGKLNH